MYARSSVSMAGFSSVVVSLVISSVTISILLLLSGGVIFSFSLCIAQTFLNQFYRAASSYFVVHQLCFRRPSSFKKTVKLDYRTTQPEGIIELEVRACCPHELLILNFDVALYVEKRWEHRY